MGNSLRLRKSRDFGLVRREGRRRSDDRLVVMARRNGLESSRFGFVTSKRLGKAVLRNKIKRRLREAALLSRAEGGWDVVVIARKNATVAGFHSLKNSLNRLLQGVGVKTVPSPSTSAVEARPEGN